MGALHRYPEGRYHGKREEIPSDHAGLGKTVWRALFFPLLFFYLELVLHLYMGAQLSYAPIWLLFSLAAGCLLSALTMPFFQNVNRVLANLFSPLVTLVYQIELVAKKILTNYYPFSTLSMAVDNQLTDYADAIGSTILNCLPVLIVMLLPTLFLWIIGWRVLDFRPLKARLAGAAAALTVAFHLLGLLVVNLPWRGDLTPAKLYQVDTNLDDQVEQLGLLTMLRLDLKHYVIPASSLLDDDFGEIPVPSVQPTALPTRSPAASSTSAPNPAPTPSPTPTIDISPNVMDVDLSALAAGAPNEEVQWLANYFSSKTPTNKNQYTGMFAGYNVIFLTLEGFSGYGISETLTPTLYKLVHKGFVFQNFYTALHYTSTSGGECQNLLGLYPKAGNPSSMKRTGVLGTNCYFSLAQQLGRLGYTNLGYHANGDMYGRLKSHTNLGYEWRQDGSGLELEKTSGGSAGWPQRDKYLIDATVDDYLSADSPFNIYYLTISGHMPYSNNWVTRQYRDIVDALPYSETTRNYLATCIEVDRALEELIAKLEEAGKLESTLIVASPDHIPYFNVEVLEELAGHAFGSSKDMEALNESGIDVNVYRNNLIIWSASMAEPVKVDKVCCQVDILPTVSNLLGLTYDSRMLSGSDILAEGEGQVIFHSRSWLTDRGYYNRYTQEFTPAQGVSMTAEETETYVSNMKKQVSSKLDCTALLIENDFYNYVFG